MGNHLTGSGLPRKQANRKRTRSEAHPLKGIRVSLLPTTLFFRGQDHYGCASDAACLRRAGFGRALKSSSANSSRRSIGVSSPGSPSTWPMRSAFSSSSASSQSSILFIG